MNLTEIRTEIDEWLQPLLVGAWWNQSGRDEYWQGLESHATPPNHIDTVTILEPDQLATAPTDQAESWHDAEFVETPVSKWPCSMRVDVYNGPQGVGFVLILSFTFNGVLNVRAINEGPETHREHGWIEYATE